MELSCEFTLPKISSLHKYGSLIVIAGFFGVLGTTGTGTTGVGVIVIVTPVVRLDDEIRLDEIVADDKVGVALDDAGFRDELKTTLELATLDETGVAEDEARVGEDELITDEIAWIEDMLLETTLELAGVALDDEVGVGLELEELTIGVNDDEFTIDEIAGLELEAIGVNEDELDELTIGARISPVEVATEIFPISLVAID